MSKPKTIDAATEARREYFRQWRAKNKDKVKEYNRKYWEKRASEKLQTREATVND